LTNTRLFGITTLALAGVFSASGVASAATLPSLTFNKQIAPIIYNNCSYCHRPGEAAPFSLLSWKDVAKKGKLIAAVTASHYMPPWKAEQTSYSFKDERRLTESQIAMIAAWVKEGMPEGNPADAPALPTFKSGWMLGEPDLVVELPAAFHIPAEGADIYRNIALPLGLTEDKWLTAVDMKPTARTVVHHVLYFADPSGKAHLRKDGDEPGFPGMTAGNAPIQLGGWALGAQPHREPEGLALRLPKGSDFIIQYHFHPTGKAEAEKALVGFYFAKEAPRRTLMSLQLPPTYGLFSGMDIPPDTKDYVLRDSYVLPADLDAVSVGAHAHYIAKEMKMTATLPGGEVKTLLWIKDWDFAWQDRYYFDQFVSLPKGTRIDGEVHWDNTTGNPRNPSNPTIRVTWGEQSKDEMGSVFLQGVPHDEADLQLLRNDYGKHQNETMNARIKSDPAFMKKIQALLAQ
jgi:hypothetical protein